jgi:hypothetical protein
MAVTTNQQSVQDHLGADTDSAITAIHHTLGPGAFQASPGSHRHDGVDSFRIKFSDIEDGWMNIDGGEPHTIYNPIPSVDGGGI